MLQSVDNSMKVILRILSKNGLLKKWTFSLKRKGINRMKIFKVIKRHKKNCSAVRMVKEGYWKTPWFFKEFYYFYTWHRVGRIICNSTDCEAELRIDIREIEEGYKDII